MKHSTHHRWHRTLAMLAVAVLTLLVAGPVSPAQAQDYVSVNGSGSTWSANAISAWVGDVQSNGIQVDYVPVGSTRGRTEFADRLTVFGVSEIPFQEGQDERGNFDNSKGRKFGYMPVVAGGTAFMYHVKVSGRVIRGLRLSGETIAKIFTGQITNWNDAAITADNNGTQLPSKRIVPVVRSDGSGTTAQFTTYLNNRHAGIWRPFFGRDGFTSYFPTKPGTNFVAQNGSESVANYISADFGDGAIGYVEYSYAKGKRDWPVAKVLNDKGYYTLPTDFNVAVALTAAQIETANRDPRFYLTQKLEGVYGNQDQRTYPLSSYSYMVIPTDLSLPMTNEKGRTLSAFAFYFLCEGQQKAGSLGYSPLPLNLVRAGFDQVRTIPGHENQFLNESRCNNPTFDPANPNRNLLAERAPAIPECDKKGAGPCTDGNDSIGRLNPNANGGNNTGNSGGNGAGNGTGGTGTGATDPAAQGAIDPETGLPIGADGTNGEGASSFGTPTEVAAFRNDSMTSTLGVLVALELILVLIVPALVARHLARKKGEKQ